MEGLEVTVLAPLAFVLFQMALGGDFDSEAKLVVIERLQQVAMRMRLPRTGNGVEIGAGGDINDGHTAAALKFTGGVDAIELAGKVNVQQNEIRAEFFKPFQRFLSRGAYADDYIAELAERRGHVTADEAFVFDDQDADAVRTSHFPG